MLAYPQYPPHLINFLSEFEKAVFSGDIESIAPYFKEDVISYGTRTIVNFNKTSLIGNQWGRIWGKCKSWQVTSLDSARLIDSGGYLTFRWERVNLDETTTLGRSTLVFEIDDNQSLKVAHSHFSENPET